MRESRLRDESRRPVTTERPGATMPPRSEPASTVVPAAARAEHMQARVWDDLGLLIRRDCVFDAAVLAGARGAAACPPP